MMDASRGKHHGYGRPARGKLSSNSQRREEQRRQRNPMRFRPPVRRISPDYSHIKVVARGDPSEQPNKEAAIDDEEEFVTRPSLEDEMQQEEEDDLLNNRSTIHGGLARNSSSSHTAPKSFAEAATMGRRSGNNDDASVDGTRNLEQDQDGSQTQKLSSLALSCSSSSSLTAVKTFRASLKPKLVPRKQRSRWSPFDISTADSSIADSGSEAGGALLDGPPSTWNSPILRASQSDSDSRASPQSPSLESRQPSLLQDHHELSAPASPIKLPHKHETFAPPSPQQHFYSEGSEVDLDLTPTHVQHVSSELSIPFPLTPTNLTVNPFVALSQAPSPSLLLEGDISRATIDTDSQSDILNGIMARIDDAFDVEEWDPDLPSIDLANSPEQMTLKPEPVMTYTTVGSLVKSNTPPHFNPPIRIQREGAGRRPLLALPSRIADPYFNSMRNQTTMMGSYGSPPPYHPYNSPPGRNNFAMNEAEENRLRSLGVSPPKLQHNLDEIHVRGQVDTHRPASQPLTRSTTMMSSSSTNSRQDHQDIMMSSHSTLGSIPTQSSYEQPDIMAVSLPDRMQSLQSLIKIPNPTLQQAIKDRLDGLAASVVEFPPGSQTISSQPGKTMILREDDTRDDKSLEDVLSATLQHANISAHDSHIDDASDLPYGPAAKAKRPPPRYPFSNSTVRENLRIQGGRNNAEAFLDTAFRFPVEVNDNFAPQSNHAEVEIDQQKENSAASYQYIHGRPQPLTAGPPGRRTADRSFMSLNPSVAKVDSFDPKQAHPSLQPDRYANHQYQRSWEHKVHGMILPAYAETFNHLGNAADARCGDSLSLQEMEKYYPRGLPRGLEAPTGKFEPLTERVQAEMGMSRKGLDLIRKEETEARFGYGLRILNHTMDDHVTILSDRDSIARGHAPAKPHLRPIGSEREEKTLRQVEAMTAAECATPLLGHLFGTLAGYADQVKGPKQKRVLSNWVDAPASAIDTSTLGNKTFFGENWGAGIKKSSNDLLISASISSDKWRSSQ